jgi:hypothetical protein
MGCARGYVEFDRIELTHPDGLAGGVHPPTDGSRPIQHDDVGLLPPSHDAPR